MNEIRIPLDQYAYINVKFEGTPDETLEEYRRLIALSKAPVSPENATPKDFKRIIDTYLKSNSIVMEDYDLLGRDKIFSQQDVVNIIKNALTRITEPEGKRADNINRK
tara:strand:+ start:216 stop:539 length:324 start_codon:yes stop_codon:yes gene_type:complete